MANALVRLRTTAPYGDIVSLTALGSEVRDRITQSAASFQPSPSLEAVKLLNTEVWLKLRWYLGSEGLFLPKIIPPIIGL